MMYKTPTFAEAQQYNRPFSMGHLSAFIIPTGNWAVATSQWKKSCNKNSMKNIVMLEKYIINVHVYIF